MTAPAPAAAITELAALVSDDMDDDGIDWEEEAEAAEVDGVPVVTCFSFDCG